MHGFKPGHAGSFVGFTGSKSEELLKKGFGTCHFYNIHRRVFLTSSGFVNVWSLFCMMTDELVLSLLMRFGWFCTGCLTGPRSNERTERTGRW